MNSRHQRTQFTKFIVSIIMVAIALASCSSSSKGSVPSATTSSTSTTSTGPTTTTTLEPESGVGRISFVYGPVVGDCVDLRSIATGKAVTTRVTPTSDATLKTDKDVILRLSCDLPHQYEVIAVPNAGLAPSPTPSADQFTAAAKKLCPLTFASYIGIAYPSSSLEAGWILPSEEQRNRGVQTIGCTAFDPKGKLTSSIRDSKR